MTIHWHNFKHFYFIFVYFFLPFKSDIPKKKYELYNPINDVEKTGSSTATLHNNRPVRITPH